MRWSGPEERSRETGERNHPVRMMLRRAGGHPNRVSVHSIGVMRERLGVGRIRSKAARGATCWAIRYELRPRDRTNRQGRRRRRRGIMILGGLGAFGAYADQALHGEATQRSYEGLRRNLGRSIELGVAMAPTGATRQPEERYAARRVVAPDVDGRRLPRQWRVVQPSSHSCAARWASRLDAPITSWGGHHGDRSVGMDGVGASEDHTFKVMRDARPSARLVVTNDQIHA
jgi:hypothetical protein